MNFSDIYSYRYAGLVFLVPLALSLVNIDWFIYPTLAAYYGFCMAGCVCIIFIVGSLLPGKRQTITSNVKSPLVYFALWSLYILMHGLLGSGTNLFHVYTSIIFLFFFSATVGFGVLQIPTRALFIGIAIIAASEAGYCILQYTGIITSKSSFFSVTGTLINPNVTAMFLAMAFPVFLFLHCNSNKKYIRIGIIIVLLALLLLKCRTAIIGTGVAAIVFFNCRYQFLAWLKESKNRSSSIILVVLSLCLLIPAGFYMYTAKQSSADGRKLIWKLSAQMAFEKPVFGYGYDSFEKEYNQFQARYIKNGKTSEEELRYAAPVKMAYNELLQNAVEGGLPGLLLWLSVMISLVIPPFLQNKKKTDVKQPDTEPEQNMLYACYSGIVAFAFMSVVNFTIQAIPVMCLFVLYAAILTAMPCNRKAATNSRFAILSNHVLFNKVTRVAKATLILIACLCGFHVYTLANADRQQKIAIDLNRQGSSKKALTIMTALERKLSGYDSYWKSYGTINLQTKEYSVALSKFLRARELSSSPDIYLNIGYCFGKLGQYAEAVKAYEQAVLFDPGKFANRYRLMNACMQNSDTLKAVSTAQGIITLKPKIPSDKVKDYKNAAIRLLQNLKIPFSEDRVFTYDLKLN